MADVPLEQYFLGGSAHGVVEYNDVNMRISRFYWENVPPGCVVYVVIWDTLNANYPNPVFSGTFTDSGETPVAGNYQAVMEEDPLGGDDYPAIPPNIIVKFGMTCSGA